MVNYRYLGNSGFKVSEITYGNWITHASQVENDRAIATVHAALDAGITTFDTADTYANTRAEVVLGEALKGQRRESLEILTKVYFPTGPKGPNDTGLSRKHIRDSVEGSLRRLGTDYIDLYWLHVWDDTTPVDEIMRGLDDLVSAGKILYLAVSDTPAWRIAQANTLAELRGWSRFVALQVEYNLALRDAERDLIPMAMELGLGVLPWSPLASGLLSGKYSREDLEKQRTAAQGGGVEGSRPLTLTETRIEIAEAVKAVAAGIGRTPAQVALAWLLARPGVASPILGARTLAQIEDNLGALDVGLDAEALQRLEAASAITLGFPHDFIASDMVRGIVTGGTTIERRR